MSVLDLIFIGLFVLAGFGGFKQGLVRQAASLAGLIIGIWGAIHFSSFTASLITEHLGFTSSYLPLISFAVTFAAILVGVHFVGLIVDGIFNLAFLGVVNRLLGVVFSVLKTALILSVIILFVNMSSSRFGFPKTGFGSQSLFYGPVERFAPAIFPYLNFEEIKDTIQDKFTPKEHKEQEDKMT